MAVFNENSICLAAAVVAAVHQSPFHFDSMSHSAEWKQQKKIDRFSVQGQGFLQPKTLTRVIVSFD